MAKITIDAVPDKTYTGKVTEIGNSPIQTTTRQRRPARQATNFKVVVTVDSEIPDVRPGFACTPRSRRRRGEQSLALPIQATTVREMVVDDKGEIVRTPIDRSGRSAPAACRPRS